MTEKKPTHRNPTEKYRHQEIKRHTKTLLASPKSPTASATCLNLIGSVFIPSLVPKDGGGIFNHLLFIHS